MSLKKTNHFFCSGQVSKEARRTSGAAAATREEKGELGVVGSAMASVRTACSALSDCMQVSEKSKKIS